MQLHPIVAELSRIRHRQGSSMRAAGGLAGLSKETVFRWENGQRIPQLDSLTAYADSLGYELALRPKTPATEKEHNAP
ncbi:helix-turn-helix domain-containing protein [Actinomadura scrupuli]|uniref:helix-turn-helix domain-containing protein n=1 Tax=Actinomadura scrupuli TaxID=559629 RepID=UPI003D957D85